MIRSRHPLWWPGKTDVLHAAQNESWRFTGAGREEKGRSIMDLLAAWRGCLDDCFAFFGTFRLKERFHRSKAEVEAIMIHFQCWDFDVLQAVAVVAVQDVGGHGPKCKRNKPSRKMFRWCVASQHTRKSRDGQEDQEGRWRDQLLYWFCGAGRCLKPEAIRCW